MNKLKLSLLTLALISSSAFCGDEEEQRKYDFTDYTPEVISLLESGGYVSGLNIDAHSTYTYMDIYFDTEDLDLYHNGFSFRVRKRTYDDGEISWGAQLKSEMNAPGEERMEVEIDTEEMQDYLVKFQGEDTRLTQILNTVFNAINNKVAGADKLNIKDELDEIADWAEAELKDAKRAPSRAPFETLYNLHLDQDHYDFDDLKGFAPIVGGVSVRVRSHIYVDLNNTTDALINLPASEKSNKKTPDYLQADHLIWTMEASYDNSTFIPLRKGTLGQDGWCNDCGRIATLREYEVENKYKPLDEGSFVLDIYEEALTDLGGYTTLNSKFHQAISSIYEVNQ